MKFFGQETGGGDDGLPTLIRKEAVVQLTPLGKQKLDQFSGAEGPRFDVLALLRDHGKMPLSDIADEGRMREEKVRHIVRDLIRKGYVERTKEE